MQIIGTLCGWDRRRFRGTLRMLANVTGLGRFLRYTDRGLVKEFGRHALWRQFKDSFPSRGRTLFQTPMAQFRSSS